MVLNIGDRAPQFGRREPPARLAQGGLRGGIAAEEMDHERIGQYRGIQLARRTFAFDRAPRGRGCMLRRDDQTNNAISATAETTEADKILKLAALLRLGSKARSKARTIYITRLTSLHLRDKS